MGVRPCACVSSLVCALVPGMGLGRYRPATFGGGGIKTKSRHELLLNLVAVRQHRLAGRPGRGGLTCLALHVVAYYRRSPERYRQATPAGHDRQRSLVGRTSPDHVASAQSGHTFGADVRRRPDPAGPGRTPENAPDWFPLGNLIRGLAWGFADVDQHRAIIAGYCRCGSSRCALPKTHPLVAADLDRLLELDVMFACVNGRGGCRRPVPTREVIMPDGHRPAMPQVGDVDDLLGTRTLKPTPPTPPISASALPILTQIEPQQLHVRWTVAPGDRLPEVNGGRHYFSYFLDA